MKYSYLILALFLTISFNLSAQPQKDIKPQADQIDNNQTTVRGFAAAEDAEDMYYIVDLNSLEEISSMFSLPESNLCLIDFSFADKPVTKLRLVRDKKTVYEEDLVGLPTDAIFEFDMNDMGLERGMYTLKVDVDGSDSFTRIVEVE